MCCTRTYTARKICRLYDKHPIPQKSVWLYLANNLYFRPSSNGSQTKLPNQTYHGESVNICIIHVRLTSKDSFVCMTIGKFADSAMHIENKSAEHTNQTRLNGKQSKHYLSVLFLNIATFIINATSIAVISGTFSNVAFNLFRSSGSCVYLST